MPGTIRLNTDAGWRSFDRDRMETAWLAREGAESLPAAVRTLVDEHGWDRLDAMEYVVAAGRWDGKD